MVEANSTHRANVVRITEVRKHPNADRLEIIPIPGTDYQYVGGIGQVKPGDLAIYIQPDSVVPERGEFAFIWEPNSYEGGVPEKKRRIRARKFRGEWSEGLLLPVTAFKELENANVVEGADFAELLGIYHYNPPEDADTRGENEKGPMTRGVWPRSLKGWFFFILRILGFDVNGKTGGSNTAGPRRPEYDVESYKNYKNAFDIDEQVVATEKIHGSNARFTFDETYCFGPMKMYVGSRRLWKSEKSKCIWRRVLADHPWIEEWCRAHPAFTLYGEVVPTQKGYDYGCVNGETKFFVFDILKPSRQWASLKERDELASEQVLANWVPYIHHGPFEPEVFKKLADGPSTVFPKAPAKHRREGIVVRAMKERDVRHLGRLQLKIVSNEFLAAEG